MLPSLLTPRDQDILAALHRCPLTVRQLLTLSETFPSRFASERRVRQRLQTLTKHGFVRRWQFAAVGQGTLNYYTLSPLGFQVLYGLEAPLPGVKTFRSVGISRLAHTTALADFLVHTVVAAHRNGIEFTGFYRENSLRLSVGEDSLYPDCAFQLSQLGNPPFSFFVELDNATERMRSDKSPDSWQRKLRLYESFQDQCQKRFRLLVVTTGTDQRLHNILTVAAELARNPLRSLVYGITLQRYVMHEDPIISPCFVDHHRKAVPLVPRPRKQLPPLVSIPVPTLAVATS
jgi:hypothetical protein